MPPCVLAMPFSGLFVFLREEHEWDVGVRLYTAPALVNLFLVLLLINIAAWRRFGVDHVRAFRLEKIQHIYFQQLVKEAVNRNLRNKITSFSFREIFMYVRIGNSNCFNI